MTNEEINNFTIFNEQMDYLTEKIFINADGSRSTKMIIYLKGDTLFTIGYEHPAYVKTCCLCEFFDPNFY